MVEPQAKKYYIWKEWYILCSVMFQHFAMGVVVSYPAILMPGITRENSDIHTTRDKASWMVSSSGMASAVGYMIIPGIQQLYGRKVGNVFVNAVTLISSIIIGLAPNVTTLQIGMLLRGFPMCGIHLCCYILGEFTHPKRRGFFIVIKANTLFFGILICHCIAPILTWRQTNWLVAIPSVLGILFTLTWPESPSWLAYQGRYEKCRESFTWARGEESDAKKELNELIIAQKALKKQNSDYNNLRGIATAFGKKEFLKPSAVLIVTSVLLNACGHQFMVAFVIEIMTKLTGDSSKAYYFILGFDSMKILAGLLSSILITLLRRRSLFILSGSALIFFMGMICICSYLFSKSVISTTWLVPALLVAYNAMCYIGIIPLSIVFLGEILPLQYRGLGATVKGVITSILISIVMKITPIMLDRLDLHGTFLIYLVIAICSFVCLLIILPETKDKTLQNIELDFMDVKIKFDEEEHASMPLNAKENENK